MEERAQGLRNRIHQLEQQEAKIRDKKFGTGTVGCVVLLILLVIGFLCAGLIGSIVVFVAYVIIAFLIDLLFFEKRRNRKADSLRTSQILPASMQLEECENRIERMYETKVIRFFQTHFPPECQSIDALQFFLDALQYGKAETEKELFNLWADEAYRQQMMQMQVEQIRQTQQIAESQKQQSSAMEHQTRLMQQQLKQQKKLSRQVRYGNVVNTLDFLKEK